MIAFYREHIVTTYDHINQLTKLNDYFYKIVFTERDR